MNFLRSLFWNRDQRRLRALWRLTLQVALMAILAGLSQLLLYGLSLAPLGFLDLPGLWQGISQVVLLLAILASIALAGRFFDRRPLRAFGFHFSPLWWSDFVFGLALGAGLMLFIFLAELAAGWIEVTGLSAGLDSAPGGLFLPIVLYICVGIQEEIITRGYLLRNLAEGLPGLRLSPRLALLAAYLASSILFGLLHAANPNATLISTLNLILAGLFLGLPFVLSGELAISIGIHISWNFFQGNVFGFPVSGTNSGPTLIAIRQGGPLWATGGAFGPEAGVIGLLAIVLGSLLIYFHLRSRGGLHDRLAIYRPDAPDR